MNVSGLSFDGFHHKRNGLRLPCRVLAVFCEFTRNRAAEAQKPAASIKKAAGFLAFTCYGEVE